MSGNLNNFNTEENPPTSMDFDPLPSGMYLAHISASEVKETKAGTGEYLKLEFTIDEAGYENRKVWENLNISNPNEKAQQIARGMLSSLCRAIGKVGIVKDSSQLHDKPVILKLGIEPGTVQYPEPKNRVRGYYPVDTKTLKTKNLKDVKEEIENPVEAEDVEELPDFLR